LPCKQILVLGRSAQPADQVGDYTFLFLHRNDSGIRAQDAVHRTKVLGFEEEV
jgi:hypothetical protein